MPPLLANSTIDWSSDEGQRRLQETSVKRLLYRLSENFQPQINPYYCGIATAVILVNTVRRYHPNSKTLKTAFEIFSSSPESYGALGFPLCTQQSLLNERTDSVKCRKKITSQDPEKLDPGLSLADLNNLLRLYGFRSEAVEPSGNGWCARFRAALHSTINQEHCFLVVNFLGSSLGKPIGGHFSPIAAYHEATDSVLVMDVAQHKTGWYWVSVEALLLSMAHLDNDRRRGFVLAAVEAELNAAQEENA